MKASGSASAFLLLVATVSVLPHDGYTQQEGAMGISITLKPIQTIRVDGSDYRGLTTLDSATTGYRKEHVMGFGTSVYGVSVNRIAVDSLVILKNEVMGQIASGNWSKIVGQPGIRREKETPTNPDRQLLIYSISVR